MPGEISRFPPIQHPVVDPQTGHMTRPWVLWIQHVVQLPAGIQRGTRATQPPAGSVSPGTLYGVSDENVIERSNGTSWESFGTV